MAVLAESMFMGVIFEGLFICLQCGPKELVLTCFGGI